jgi:hypothetical protein
MQLRRTTSEGSLLAKIDQQSEWSAVDDELIPGSEQSVRLSASNGRGMLIPL